MENYDHYIGQRQNLFLFILTWHQDFKSWNVGEQSLCLLYFENFGYLNGILISLDLSNQSGKSNWKNSIVILYLSRQSWVEAYFSCLIARYRNVVCINFNKLRGQFRFRDEIREIEIQQFSIANSHITFVLFIFQKN